MRTLIVMHVIFLLFMTEVGTFYLSCVIVFDVFDLFNLMFM